MAKLWVQLHDYYLSDVPGCSYVTAANALRMAAQEFCERSKVWRVTMDPVLTVADISIYDFDITTEQEISKIMSVKLDDQPIAMLLHDQAGNGQIGMISLNQREFFLQPVPAAGQSLEIKAVLKPSNESTGIEDFIYAAHAEAIAQGAKARLFGLANQPFTNPKAAMDARSAFETAIAQAIIKSAKAYSGAPLRTAPSFM